MSATGTALSADKHQQAVQHFRDGRLEEALHLLGEAIAEDETSERWNDWAAIQLAAHNVTDAEKGLRRALQLEPENLQAAANLGAVLATLGKTEEAIPLLERGLPGVADDEKAIVSQLLHQCRSKLKESAPAATSDAQEPPTFVTKILTTQTSALNSVALRLITLEGTLDRLIHWFTRTLIANGQGLPENGRTQLLHRASTTYAITAAAADGYAQDDIRLVERLLAAYRHCAAEFESFRNSMWRDFFDERHQEAHKIFMQGQTDLAAAILRNPASSDLFYGFDNLALSTHKKIVQQGEENMVMDHLIRLAEALGAQRVDNPMAYLFRRDSTAMLDPVSADTVVERIEHALGSKLLFPNPYPGERGVHTSRGIISYRAVPALYHAWRIKKLLKGIARPRVLEIGAGLGRAAYYAWQLGIRDYTVIDIPMTSICQGYFLGRLLGEDAVLLAGEDPPSSENRIRILPPSAFLKAADHYDLVLNADSFTELGESVAQDYWNQIESRAGIFLSINHESNAFNVRQFVEKSSRVDSYDRYPYWIHNGYVEETARFKQS
jgi:tetratricopeptide (TPR) repeat protein